MLGLETNAYSNLLLMVVFAIGAFSYLPQIIKAIRTKKTADIAVPSYALLSLAYLGMIAYAFAFTKDKTFLLLEAIEGAMCMATLCLAAKYQHKGKSQ
jgi:uncharacterized protein with PQ loop repeat